MSTRRVKKNAKEVVVEKGDGQCFGIAKSHKQRCKTKGNAPGGGKWYCAQHASQSLSNSTTVDETDSENDNDEPATAEVDENAEIEKAIAAEYTFLRESLCSLNQSSDTDLHLSNCSVNDCPYTTFIPTGIVWTCALHSVDIPKEQFGLCQQVATDQNVNIVVPIVEGIDLANRTADANYNKPSSLKF
jgi:hypothetical protein